MAEQWLIDGYNLLHALQPRNSKENLFSREQLISSVAGFASFKKVDTLLVLDGVGDPAELSMYRTTHFEVVFAQKVPADTYIEKYLYQNRETRKMVVVTNDRAIGRLGRGGGAQVLSTSAFAELLKETKKEGSEVIQKRKSLEHGFNRPFEDKLKDL